MRGYYLQAAPSQGADHWLAHRRAGWPIWCPVCDHAIGRAVADGIQSHRCGRCDVEIEIVESSISKEQGGYLVEMVCKLTAGPLPAVPRGMRNAAILDADVIDHHVHIANDTDRSRELRQLPGSITALMQPAKEQAKSAPKPAPKKKPAKPAKPKGKPKSKGKGKPAPKPTKKQLEQLTVLQLRERCKAAGMSTGGKKNSLIRRLS